MLDLDRLATTVHDSRAPTTNAPSRCTWATWLPQRTPRAVRTNLPAGPRHGADRLHSGPERPPSPPGPPALVQASSRGPMLARCAKPRAVASRGNHPNVRQESASGPRLQAEAHRGKPGHSYHCMPVPRRCVAQLRSRVGRSGRRYRTSSAIRRLSGRGPGLAGRGPRLEASADSGEGVAILA
jgi:hypothetical protein